MTINAEWDRLTEVLVHRPGVEMEYAMLSPQPFLFERPFNVAQAREEHMELERILKENGVRVRVMREEFRRQSLENQDFRKKLEEKVLSNVKFFGNLESVNREKEKFARNIKYLDPENLLHFLTLEPSIDLKKEEAGEVDYPTIYSNLPLANLYFMRDQQAVANNTVIMGRMKKKQRMREVEITDFYLSNFYGEDRMFRVSENACFEGGDFIPAGDFALMGTGPRTDLNGALEIIGSNRLKFSEYLVVENPVYDFIKTAKRSSMINMHLDTYFNIADKDLAVTSVELSRKAKASLYVNDGSGPKKTGDTTLYDYLKEKGFDFLNLRISEQLSYSSNFLTLGPSKIVAVNAGNVLKKLLGGNHFDEITRSKVEEDLSKGPDKLFPLSKEISQFGIDVIPAELSELTGGYGGAHCMTASLDRN